MVLRIAVDFNTLDLKGRVFIPTHVCPELLDSMQPGRQVLLYEAEDFEVEATLEFYEASRQWRGKTDWSTLRYL